MEELTQKILADHAPEHRHTRPPDFIDEVLELNRTDPHFMPETNLLLTVLEAFMVGLDTVSSLCTFISYELFKTAGAARARDCRSRRPFCTGDT